MNTWTIFAVVLALAVCQIAASPRGGRGGSGGRRGPQGGGAGGFMGFGGPGQQGGFGGFGRPGHHGHHGRTPGRKAICKLNTTEIDYDVACDLPEYYECVEVVPRDNDGPGNGRFGASNYGRRGGRRGGHHGGRHEQGEISFCEQKNCTVDSDCAGDFSCVDGVCNITRDMKLYAVACNVTDEEGNVRKERTCPGEMVCGPCPREITYDGENLTASFCRRERHGGRHGGPLSNFFGWVFGGSSEEEDDCPGQSEEDNGSWSWGWGSSESEEEDMSEEEPSTESPMVTEQDDEDPIVGDNDIDP